MGAMPEKQPHELYIAPLTGIVKCSVTGRWIPLINVLLCREKASYNCGTGRELEKTFITSLSTPLGPPRGLHRPNFTCIESPYSALYLTSFSSPRMQLRRRCSSRKSRLHCCNASTTTENLLSRSLVSPPNSGGKDATATGRH